MIRELTRRDREWGIGNGAWGRSNKGVLNFFPNQILVLYIEMGDVTSYVDILSKTLNKYFVVAKSLLAILATQRS
ncbi:hypothetical protein [aff. Roholtiella sp. LEGE 12411]|uniref:hypothetical protein n=1 Tax=aff. Roholtiella sp. LEGE 12411 TaxID=1828822 RepID=UPI00187F3554|nr:hypothetical protein [aff. Roholtiella sp. LEGE 12411]MBE9034781.1 hypothetical protein [aff. Roholtiella sp. LEGE 12411]